MVLGGYVKQCKKCDFLLGEEGFHKFLVIGQPNDSLQNLKTHQNICALNASQLIKLIHMNHNKYN
jgi:hypothetical protein